MLSLLFGCVVPVCQLVTVGPAHAVFVADRFTNPLVDEVLVVGRQLGAGFCLAGVLWEDGFALRSTSIILYRSPMLLQRHFRC